MYNDRVLQHMCLRFVVCGRLDSCRVVVVAAYRECHMRPCDIDLDGPRG